MGETEGGAASPAAKSSGIEAALSAADLEWQAIGTDDDLFTVAGVRPGCLCAPATVDEVSAAVRAASAAGGAVIPWGGGTRMSLGFPPRSADLVLQTFRLSEIVEYEPADLTVTVQAGMPLADLQARLGAEGQMLALDPAAADRATIGGLIAANASGPLRLLYGTARDVVIGTRVVNADGIISKAGGRVVKNVAGYDLNKLYVGSLGTVGVIVELSFKLHPLPANEGMLLAAFSSAAEAAAPIAALMRSPLGPAAVELLDAGGARRCRAGRLRAGVREGGPAPATGYPGAVLKGQRHADRPRGSDAYRRLGCAPRVLGPVNKRGGAAQASRATGSERGDPGDGPRGCTGGRICAAEPGARGQWHRLP
jgi:glycolate oxidase FAD binding subunit